ncbi:MAG: TIGR03013 family XrtA/PEP-CTERM system glycosyltransferase [bacterium]|nr:TIGR03013 family PEP-CTERM/XrtA system glycosyltransferase [Planctomycetota bacterium]HIL52198.1 TIGR03013 family PEP-CTERM/XrtA system glycosyltransferase [Planctomycetota bacterium]
MLRVLSHYLPVRKALLVLSETLILWLVLGFAGTVHLANPGRELHRALAHERGAMTLDGARFHCYVTAFLLAVLVQFAISFNELYDFRISQSRYDRARHFVGSMGSAIFVSLLAVGLAHLGQLDPLLDFPGISLGQKVRMLVFALLISFLLLFLWRTLFHHLLHRAKFYDRVLILGSSKAAHLLAKETREHADSGYEIAGIVPEQPSTQASVPGLDFDVDEFGTADLVLDGLMVCDKGLVQADAAAPHLSLAALVAHLDINEIVVAFGDRRGKLPIDDLLRCRLGGTPVRSYDEVFERVAGKISVEAMRPSYLIFGDGFARHPWADLVKRLLDLAVALPMLACLWPVMILTMICVRMGSEGPALFSQERVGRDGRLFTLFKFRSMYADAEKRSGPVWATSDDPRITRVGNFIRKTRLDELPQLFNVIGGSMSLVGPRPEREVFVKDLAQAIPYFDQRHIVKPGLTGWAQINYPYGNTVGDALQKLQYDLFYIKYQSLIFDLSILFNTIKTILLRRGT